jgi:hypothetical protein
MSDPFRSPPGTNPPRHVREPNYTPWLGAAVIAVVLGFGFWGMSHRTPPTAANSPAVVAAPAPAAGVPAPAPQETTGETTGQTTPRAQ